MIGVIHALRRNLADVRSFGVRFPLRHLARLSGEESQAVDLAGVGRICLRRGTTDVEVFRQVFQAGEYDLGSLKRYADINARYEALLASGHVPVIVDAGANVGAASLWFARSFPRSRIVAVEPEPANAACCRANIASRPSISLREAAIGSRSGSIRLSNPAGKAWSPRSQRSDDGQIDVVTIAELVGEVADGVLFIVKIDIEGFESDLFADNLDWIDAATVILIELHDWMLPGARTSFALQRAMGERRFEIVISGENLIYINVGQFAR